MCSFDTLINYKLITKVIPATYPSHHTVTFLFVVRTLKIYSLSSIQYMIQYH